MNPTNLERKQKAAELFREIPRVRLCLTPRYRALVCSINDKIYVRTSGIVLDSKWFYERIPERFRLNLRAENTVVQLVEVNYLVENLSVFRAELPNNGFLDGVVEALTFKVPDISKYSFSQEEINNSNTCAALRRSLIAKSLRSTLDNEEEKNKVETPRENPTLQELVERIESMGWEVTLRLKQ